MNATVTRTIDAAHTAAVVAALAARQYDTQINFRTVGDKSLVPITQESRNGLTRPVPNTMTGIVWQIADFIYNERVAVNEANKENPEFKALLPVPLISEVLEIFEGVVVDAKGPTARQQLGYWVKFYGLEAMRDERVKAEGSAEEEAKAAAKAEKERIKAEKQAEKDRLKTEKEAKALEKLAADEGKLTAAVEAAKARAKALEDKVAALNAAKAKAAADAKAAAKAAAKEAASNG